jgi:hypothetical protein
LHRERQLVVDFASKSAKTEYTRVQGNNIPRGGGAGFPVQGDQKFVEVVNGSTGWNVNPQGQPVRVAATDAGDRQLALWTNPIGFIKAGLAAPNAAATDRYYGRENRTLKVIAFTVKVCDGPQPQCTRRLTGEFNNDNMLERVITWVPDPVMGDKMVEYRYSDYRDAGNGVKYGNQTVELYHVEGLNHSDNMAIAYLPKEKIVINADLYGPPAAGGNLPNVNANSVALFRNLKRLKLDVAQHVPIHGNPGPNADFGRIVGPVAARAPATGGGG